MGRPAYFVGPWDLDRRLACVPDDPSDGTVVLVESVAKGGAMPWHRKKLVLVLSALHHFARELEADGHDVQVVNAATYVDGIRRHVQEHGSTEVHAMRPREWGLQQALEDADLGVPLTLHDDGGPGGHFLLPRDEVASWLDDQGESVRMDVFYRRMRKHLGVLLEDGDKPVGGKWSFDADNRKKKPDDVAPPTVSSHTPDALTEEVMARVATWPDLWGDVDGFDWPVTRDAALQELDDFVAHRLDTFGDFQDALVDGEPFLWHARLSTSMNLGLLSPQDVVDAVLERWRDADVPLNAVEGFVRQVVGWREFMRGIYWKLMPGLRDANLLGADRPLPAAFWDPERTDMRCLQDAVRNVKQHGYAHHIQRLMILGNFAMLVGVRPLDVSHWFWAGFVDAYEWVELPNVHGMAVYADDTFTTKPYAASGNYVKKMGDHCAHCAYDVRKKSGEGCCPLNPLFWHFMVRHRDRLSDNFRLKRLYATWDRMSDEKRSASLESAESFLETLEPADHGWSFDDDAC